MIHYKLTIGDAVSFGQGWALPDGATELTPDVWEQKSKAAREQPEPQPQPLRLSFLQFIDLFTEEEQLAIAGAAMTDAPTKLWYDRAVGAQFVDLSDPRLRAGLQVMVDGGDISTARKDRVLAGLPPEG